MVFCQHERVDRKVTKKFRYFGYPQRSKSDSGEENYNVFDKQAINPILILRNLFQVRQLWEHRNFQGFESLETLSTQSAHKVVQVSLHACPWSLYRIPTLG